MQFPAARGLTGRIARLRPDRVTLLLAALAVLSAALILTRQVNYGVGVGTDSLAYAAAAEAIAAGNSPLLLSTTPLFSAALSLASLLGFEPISAAAYLNAAAFGMVVFLSTLWLWRKTQSPFAVVWTGVALAIAPPLIEVTTWVLQEPLFILLTMSALLTLDAFTKNRRRSHLLLAASFAALAFLTRYPGAAMVGTGVVLLLLQRDVAFTQRTKEAAVYAAIASLPVCAWLLRNFLEAGSFTSHARYQPFYSLSQNIEAAAAEFWAMLFAWSDLSYTLGRRVAMRVDDLIVPGLIAVAILTAGVALVIAARRSVKSLPELGRWQGVEPAFAMALFVGAYTAVVIIGLTTSSWSEGFGIRHFAPAYPPLLLAIALVANACFRNAAWKPRVLGVNVSLFAVFGATLLSLWLLPQFSLYAEQYRLHLDGPLGHDARTWGNSPAILDIRAKSLNGQAMLGTNTLDVAPYLASIPRDEFRLLPCVPADEISAWLSYAREADKEAYVVWLNGFTNAIGCATFPSTIRSIARMDAVARLPNGNVFRVSPAADPLGAYRSAYADIASVEPVIRSEFAVHLRGGALAYLREPCLPADTQDRFFLHVTPIDESDLPYDRRRHGFDNLNFDFDIHGARFDGKCLTTAVLPNYPIARVRTGQFVRGGGRLWEGEFRPSP